MGIRKLQIQAHDAQLALALALYSEAKTVDDNHPAIAAWQEASRILGDMLAAGYAPRWWGRGLAAYEETGDETPERIKELNELNWE